MCIVRERRLAGFVDMKCQTISAIFTALFPELGVFQWTCIKEGWKCLHAIPLLKNKPLQYAIFYSSMPNVN